MKIQKTVNGSVLTLAVEGRVDTVTVPELETIVKNELNGVTELIFDFAKLDYISSAGLRVLLAAQKIMNAQGSMKILNANDIVCEIFQITGFSSILTIE